jgi:hypothetical protein
MIEEGKRTRPSFVFLLSDPCIIIGLIIQSYIKHRRNSMEIAKLYKSLSFKNTSTTPTSIEEAAVAVSSI